MKTIALKYNCTAICEVNAETEDEIIAAVLANDYEVIQEDADDISQVFIVDDDGDCQEIKMPA